MSRIFDTSASILVLGVLAYWSWALGGTRALTLAQTAPWMAAALGLQALSLIVDREERCPRLHTWALWPLPFLGWALLNVAVWSPTPWRGWVELAQFGQAWVVFWIGLHGFRVRRLLWIALGTALLCALVASYYAVGQGLDPEFLPLGATPALQYVEAARRTGTFAAPTLLGMFLAMVIALSLVLGLARRLPTAMRCLLLASVLFMGWALAASGSRGPSIALACGLAALPLLMTADRRRRRQGWIAMGLIGALAVGAVFTTMPQFRDRLTDLAENRGESSRQVIWAASFEMAAEPSHTWMGSGGGSFLILFDNYKQAYALRASSAHSMILDLLVEYGVIGLLLAFVPIVYAGWRGVQAWRQYPHRRPPHKPRRQGEPRPKGGGMPFAKLLLGGCGLGLAVGLLCGIADFPQRVPAILGWMAILAAFFARGVQLRSWALGGPVTGRILLGVCLGACSWGLAGPVRALFEHQEAYEAASHQLERNTRTPPPLQEWEASNEEEVIAPLRDVVAAWPGHVQAQIYLAEAIMERRNYEPSRLDAHAEAALVHATAGRNRCPLWWRAHTAVGSAMALQAGRVDDALRHFERAVELAPHEPNALYYRAYIRMHTPGLLQEAVEDLERVLELDPEHAGAQALRQRMALFLRPEEPNL